MCIMHKTTTAVWAVVVHHDEGWWVGSCQYARDIHNAIRSGCRTINRHNRTPYAHEWHLCVMDDYCRTANHRMG
jgi:hypothetical protein